MSKVTSKLQVTEPKALAEQYGIHPGDEIDWMAAGDAIRVVPAGRREPLDMAARLDLFDEATRRQRARERTRPPAPRTAERGWKREDLYRRGSAR